MTRLTDVVPEKTEEALADEVDEVTCPCPHRPQRKGSARGSAFPDVCCSFDLLLQPKLSLPRPATHPPQPLALPSLACCHGNAGTSQ
ncbi:unnamed protein product [Gadus morhua 'NCC']